MGQPLRNNDRVVCPSCGRGDRVVELGVVTDARVYLCGGCDEEFDVPPDGRG